MSREKQIEEMAQTIHDVAEAHHIIWCTELAKILYNAGYRKASDVAEEIFAEVMQAIEKGVAEAKEKVTNSEKDFAFRDVLLHTGELYAGNIGKDICEVFKNYTQKSEVQYG